MAEVWAVQEIGMEAVVDAIAPTLDRALAFIETRHGDKPEVWGGRSHWRTEIRDRGEIYTVSYPRIAYAVYRVPVLDGLADAE